MKKPNTPTSPVTSPSQALPELTEAPSKVDEDFWEAEQPKAPAEQQSDTKADAIQHLCSGVTEFLKSRDVHRAFRRNLNALNRHLGYNGWSSKLREEFDTRFQQMLNDPIYVESICTKIMDMEMGHAVAPSNAAIMVLVTAGFLSFGLCGIN